jgi:hypothetical protein
MGSLFSPPGAPPPPAPPPAPPMFANPANQAAGASVAQQAAAVNGQGSDGTIASSPNGAATANTSKPTLGSG